MVVVFYLQNENKGINDLLRPPYPPFGGEAGLFFYLFSFPAFLLHASKGALFVFKKTEYSYLYDHDI
jgi:hypothetical protein